MSNNLPTNEDNLTVSCVIKFYHESFHEHYALAVIETSKIPNQISNEIRNSFTHLARAEFSKNEIEKLGELKKSKAHIERASRDCLKLVAAVYNKRLRKLIDDYRDLKGFITDDIKKELKKCDSLYKKCNINEAKSHDAGSLTSSYQNLIIIQSDLIDKIEKEFQILNFQGYKYSRFKRFFIKSFLKLTEWSVSAIVGWILIEIVIKKMSYIG